mmetsp:Transcript_6371/g.10642  ORF Transcript_6371/g.10642 Transcript_6371/m.10642 type:complete len:248 (-) Transcript_6371:806-1549(-)
MGAIRRARTLKSKKKKSDPPTTICADGHRCDNHSECVENPNDESQYFCDCDASAALWDEAFAGLSCEHRATTYCKHDPFFCTNGGDCQRRHAADGTKYTECGCADGYEGSHCQFVAGGAPQSWPTDAASTVITSKHHGGGGGGGGGMSTGGIVAIVVVVVALASVGAFLGWRYMAMQKETRGVLDDFADMAADSMHGGKGKSSDKQDANKTKTKKERSTELELDADGGKLKDVMDEMENEEPVQEMI